MGIQAWIIAVIILLLFCIALYIFLWFRAFRIYPVRTTLRVCMSALFIGLAAVLSPEPVVHLVTKINLAPIIIIDPIELNFKGVNDITVLIILGFMTVIAGICTFRVNGAS